MRNASALAFGAAAGFTLVELLLAVAVAVLLMGAVVFSFSNLLTGSQLDEGAEQFENLVRLVRAQAANTGRSIRLAFSEQVSETGAVIGEIEVRWEPNPLGAPGRFEPYADTMRAVTSLNEAVAIDLVQMGPDTEPVEPMALDGEAPPWLAPITFYPDGSSDSATVVLVSRDSDDARKMKVLIDGITGGLKRETVPVEGMATEANKAAANVE